MSDLFSDRASLTRWIDLLRENLYAAEDRAELARAIDETWMAREFLVCVTSARLAACEHQWVRELADAAFIAKPISVFRLVNVIERFLDRARVQDAC